MSWRNKELEEQQVGGTKSWRDNELEEQGAGGTISGGASWKNELEEQRAGGMSWMNKELEE